MSPHDSRNIQEADPTAAAAGNAGSAGAASPAVAAGAGAGADPHRPSDAELFMVDETSDLPIWAQLRNRFTFLIRTGALKEGEQLPSVRSLAATAHINYNTVARAYRDLELAGLVISLRGRGMFVQAPSSAGDTTADVDAIFEDCVKQYRALGMTYEDISGHVEDILLSLRLSAASDAAKRKELC